MVKWWECQHRWLRLSGSKQNSKKMFLSASAKALKLCNAIYDPNISYVDLHKLHNRALPSKFCTYRHCLLLFKVFNNKISNKDWLDLNFQMINTSRQTLFEIQNCAVYKVGNNILSNRLSSLNRKVQLDLLNLPFETYKIKCKNIFLSWTVLLCVLWVYFILYVLSIIMLYMHWWRNNKSFKKQKTHLM